jgi:hypothetical protein
LTASASDRTRLCASYDGKNKTSRLKTISFGRPLHPRTRPRQHVGRASGGAWGGQAKQWSLADQGSGEAKAHWGFFFFF